MTSNGGTPKMKSSLERYAGIAAAASVIANFRKCWWSAVLMLITLPFIAGPSATRPRLRNGWAGLGVIRGAELAG